MLTSSVMFLLPYRVPYVSIASLRPLCVPSMSPLCPLYVPSMSPLCTIKVHGCCSLSVFTIRNAKKYGDPQKKTDPQVQKYPRTSMDFYTEFN